MISTDTALTKDDVEWRPLGDLLLDAHNPRFGELAHDRRNQTDILDFIVKTFGVTDLLSSLAVNGYFAAEPVVCRPADDDGKLIVAEGNRRLAACLILAGNERAKNQVHLTRKYQTLHQRHDEPSIDPVPVILFDSQADKRSLLSYLGVRHIAAAKSWDSYAKAVWVSRILQETDIPLKDVAEMIGDEHRALARLLEGYHFIQQLEKNDRFRPENSNRKGRGSNTRYPFSWVYTILGYSSARRFLSLEDNSPENQTPILQDKLDDASLLVHSMFGNRDQGAAPAIDDSRQLSKLALVLESPEKVELLRQGKRLTEIEESTRPISDALRATLVSTRDLLTNLTGRLDSDPPDAGTASEFLALSKQVKNLSSAIEQKLRSAIDSNNE